MLKISPFRRCNFCLISRHIGIRMVLFPPPTVFKISPSIALQWQNFITTDVVSTKKSFRKNNRNQNCTILKRCLYHRKNKFSIHSNRIAWFRTNPGEVQSLQPPYLITVPNGRKLINTWPSCQ